MANLTGSRSSFPTQIDVFKELTDLSPSKKTQAKRYQELKMKEVLSPAEVSELNSLMTELQDSIVTPEYQNKMLDALINLEAFFLNETVGFVNTKQTEMNSYVDTKKTEMQTEINKFNYKGAYSPSTAYLKNNFVDFNDGSSNQTYLCIENCTDKEPSSNPLFWRKMTIQGQKGDIGLSGANFIFKGTWSNSVTFMKDEAVRFGGMLFVSKIDNNVGNEPSLIDDTNYWFRAMDITVTVRKMVGTRNIVSQTSTVNFMTGEITSFNPNVDSLDVYMNSTRLTKGIDYNINANNQAIDKINGTWNGTMEQPVFFEFVVTKNIINDLVFKDGSALSNGTVTRNKLDIDTQAEINKIGSIETKVGSGTLITNAQDVVGAINEHESDINSISSQISQIEQGTTQHESKKVSFFSAEFVRDISLTGDQILTGFPFVPDYIEIEAVVTGTNKVSFGKYGDGSIRVIYQIDDTKLWFNGSLNIIRLANSNTNISNAIPTINLNKTITLNWSKSGTGGTGTALIRVTAYSHGGE